MYVRHCKQLRDQLKLLKDELETLQIRISTEMVPRSDWLLAVQQAKDAENVAANLANEVNILRPFAMTNQFAFPRFFASSSRS